MKKKAIVLVCFAAVLAVGCFQRIDSEPVGNYKAALSETLRPDSEITGAGFTENMSAVGGTYSAVLADEDGGSYAKSTGATGMVTVGYPAPSAGGTVTAAIVELTARRASTITLQVQVELLDGARVIATSSWVTVNATTTDHVVIFSGLSIADPTDLRTRFTYQKLSGGTAHYRLIRAAMDVTVDTGGGAAAGPDSLRPSADVLGAGYTENAATAPHFGDLADEDDDTYVQLDQASGLVTVDYPAATPDGTVSAVDVLLRIRRHNSITARVKVELLDATAVVGTSGWFTLPEGDQNLTASFSGLSLAESGGLRTRFVYERLTGTSFSRLRRAEISVNPAGPPPGGGACAEQTDFTCTRIIGFSQTRDWSLDAPDFMSTVEDGRWEVLWNSGAGVSQWQDPGYTGWSNAPQSPCQSGSGSPDRVIYTISDGGYYPDVSYWVTNINAVIATIRSKYPGLQRIDLQAVVGGPSDGVCQYGGTDVRASVNHPYIDAAIDQVVAQHSDVFTCHSPEVTSCADYSDSTGHLLSSAEPLIGANIGAAYANL